MSGIVPWSSFLSFESPKKANLERICCAENHRCCSVPLGQMQIGFWSEWVCNVLPKSHWVSDRTWSTKGLWALRDPRCLSSIPGDSSSCNGSISCSPLQGQVAPSHFWHPQYNPWSQGTNLHSWFPLCFVTPAMIQLSSLLSAGLTSRERQSSAHIPVKLLLKSMRGQDLLGGGKQLLKMACF